MSAPETAICWEVQIDNHADTTGARLFMTGTKAGAVLLSRKNQRPVWRIQTFNSSQEAADFVTGAIREWESNYPVTITVQPGEVMLYESEYMRLQSGAPIPDSLRNRMVARMRRWRTLPPITP